MLEKLVVNGYMDIGDKWMLDTLCWWQLLSDEKLSGIRSVCLDDRFSILATSFECWCPKLMFKDRGCWWRKRPKLAPTSQWCRQHILSLTPVTNIDVAVGDNYKMMVMVLAILVASIQKSSLSLSLQYHDVTNITVTIIFCSFLLMCGKVSMTIFFLFLNSGKILEFFPTAV